jgi:diketogulonate reductase-like aldo/keto reductase
MLLFACDHYYSALPLEENIAALEVNLTPEDLQRIDEVAPKGVASGGRYPESMMSMVNR